MYSQLFTQLFTQMIRNLTGIFLPRTDFILATPSYQPNSPLQGEPQAAAQVSAAECLNDGFPQNSQFAAGPGIAATGPIPPRLSIVGGPFHFTQPRQKQ